MNNDKQTKAKKSPAALVQVQRFVMRPNTPHPDAYGTPFWQYCNQCGTPMYFSEYSETADVFGICDDCYFFTDDD